MDKDSKYTCYFYFSVGQIIKVKLKKNTIITEWRELKTGGATAELKDISPLDERILALIGLDAIKGISIPESCSNPYTQSASQESQSEYVVVSIKFPSI